MVKNWVMDFFCVIHRIHRTLVGRCLETKRRKRKQPEQRSYTFTLDRSNSGSSVSVQCQGFRRKARPMCVPWIKVSRARLFDSSSRAPLAPIIDSAVGASAKCPGALTRGAHLSPPNPRIPIEARPTRRSRGDYQFIRDRL